MKRLRYSKIREDGFTVQGYTVIGNKYSIISSYKRGYKSRLYVYNANTGSYLYTIILNDKAHVGGVAFDCDKKILFVTSSNGRVNSYDFNKIKNVMSNHEPLVDMSDFVIDNDISISGFTPKNMATICYFDGFLYASTFGIKSKLFKISYSLDDDRKMVTLENIEKIKGLGLAVQGMSFYKEKDDLYLVTSESCGKKWKSRLNLYKMNKKRRKHLNTLNIKHPGLEGVYVDKNGLISGIFEFKEQESFEISINLLKELTKNRHPFNKLVILISTLIFEKTHKKKKKKAKKNQMSNK